MRLLHTADWHLGQTFHEYDRTEEHRRFLGWLLDTIEVERPDALLVCGDVFDHANPSASAQRQLYAFLTEARRRHPRTAIVLIAGNHDSPGRLEAPSPILDSLGIVVVGRVRGEDGAIDYARHAVALPARDGNVGAWCLAVPFLRTCDLPADQKVNATANQKVGATPDLIANQKVGATPGTTAPVLQGVGPGGTEGVGPSFCLANDTYTAYTLGVRLLYRLALEAALSRRDDRQAVIALGHCHVAGARVSDSERPIVAGGLDALSSHVFDPRLAYVALGHLHRAQAVAGDERIRYAGSALPLSFSEIDYPHQVVLVDLDRDRLADVRAVPIPRFVPLMRVPLEPEPADAVVQRLDGMQWPALAEDCRPYLEVRVRLDRPEPGLRARLEAAVAGKAVRLARIDTTYPQALAAATVAASLDDLAQLKPDGVFRALYRSRFPGDVPGDLLAAFAELLREVEGEGRA